MTPILYLLAACTERQPNTLGVYEHGCGITSSLPIAADDPGAVGMSAVDAVALMDGTTVDATFVNELDLPFLVPTFTTTVTFAVSLAGDAEIQVREAYDPELCLAGDVIEVPVAVEASSPEFDQLEPDSSLPSLLSWNGPDLGSMVLQHSAYASVASWIADDAASFDCTAGGAYGPTEDRLLRFGITGPFFGTLWGADIFLECIPGPTAVLYRAQGSWP